VEIFQFENNVLESKLMNGICHVRNFLGLSDVAQIEAKFVREDFENTNNNNNNYNNNNIIFNYNNNKNNTVIGLIFCPMTNNLSTRQIIFPLKNYFLNGKMIFQSQKLIKHNLKKRRKQIFFNSVQQQ